MNETQITRRECLKSAGTLGLTLGITASRFARILADDTTGAINITSRRQLFLDDFWFDTSQDIKLALHTPIPREVVLESDRPWEDQGVTYSSVIYDDGRYQMWYRAGGRTCYAESVDGVHWTKPELGLYSFEGSKENNILGGHVFHNCTLGD